MVERIKIKGLDLEHYWCRLREYAGANLGKDVGEFAEKQREKRLVIIQYRAVMDGHWGLPEGEHLGVILFGDKYNRNDVWVLFDCLEHPLIVPKRFLVYAEGGPQGIYWPLGVCVGTYGTMGGVAKRIKNHPGHVGW